MVTVLFFLEGVLFVGLGIPLALNKVPPNGVYGFRTAKTLASPEIWYLVNRSSGIDLIVAGVLIAVVSVLLRFVLSTRPPHVLSLANLGFVVIALGAVAIKGFLKLRNI